MTVLISDKWFVKVKPDNALDVISNLLDVSFSLMSLAFNEKDNKVIKLYFLTNKNNDKKEFFFMKDISLYLESLNI